MRMPILKVKIENALFWEGVYGFKKMVKAVKVQILTENNLPLSELNIVSRDGNSKFLEINKWVIQNEWNERERVLDMLPWDSVSMLNNNYFIDNERSLFDNYASGVLLQYEFSQEQKRIDTLLKYRNVYFKYWISDEGNENFKHWTPVLKDGLRVSQIDAWQRDFEIGLSAVEIVVKEFAIKYLGIKNCNVEILEKSNFKQTLIDLKFRSNIQYGNCYEINHLSNRRKEELAKFWGVTKEYVENRIRTSLLNK